MTTSGFSNVDSSVAHQIFIKFCNSMHSVCHIETRFMAGTLFFGLWKLENQAFLRWIRHSFTNKMAVYPHFKQTSLENC